MTETKKFTEEELKKLHWRWIWHSQIGWNYERMQGLGYLTTMLPAIDKLYGDDPELKKKALETHSVFFNTTPQMGDIIVGMDLAIEENDPSENGLAVAASIKTALMGPFAGIGDTIFGMIAGAVFGSIAASMAVNGSSIGMWIQEVWCFLVLLVIRPQLFNLGYKQGVQLVTSMAGRMQALTDAASILGLVVTGGMIASMVKFPLGTITKQIGVDQSTGAPINVSYNLQSYADAIMPKLFPLLCTIWFYRLLGRKGMNSNKLIWMVIGLSILLRVCHILA